MAELTKDTQQKIAEYIGKTQPIIDQYNAGRDAFVKRAHQVAGVLANQGIIDNDVVNEFVDKIAEDTSGVAVWDLVEKLANALAPQNLGDQTEVKVASAEEMGPWEKFYHFGNPRAEVHSNSGMIE